MIRRTSHRLLLPHIPNFGCVRAYFIGTYGRLRTVEPAPGGGLWLTTSTTGDKDSIPNNSMEEILHVDLGN